MPAPVERELVTFERGRVRDEVILATYREALRALGYSEDVVAEATQPGSRFYVEADAIDLYGQARQRAGLALADQLDPSRANHEFLVDHHGRLWTPGGQLPAVGASGQVRARGIPGTIFAGDTTIGDPSAVIGTGPNGYRYQVLSTEVVPASGEAVLDVRAIDAGHASNLDPGQLLAWSENVPLNAEVNAAVLSKAGQPEVGLSGGFDVETDAAWAERIERRIRYRPASGNPSHLSVWGEEASGAVERAFVYPCAMHAGSVLVSPVEKRDLTRLAGPLARIPSAGTLADVTGYLTPPASPVFPRRALVVVTSPVPQPSDVVLRVSLSKGVDGGWYDATPWPNPARPDDPSATEVVAISSLASQTQFDIATALPLPDGATTLTGDDCPQLMVWNDETSRFERLQVQQVVDGGAVVTVTLAAAPDKALAVGDRISPYTDRLDVVAEALEAYFDSLGPGQVVADTDPRIERAVRFPPVEDEYPAAVTQQVVTEVVEALSGAAPAAELSAATEAEPELPVSVSDGPSLVVIGLLNLYPL